MGDLKKAETAVLHVVFHYYDRFASVSLACRWNSLDQGTVDAPSLNCFKNKLNKTTGFLYGLVRKNLGLVMWVETVQGKHH